MHTIGVILAGGLSSRMGQDKALLPIEQSTMLYHTQQVLSHTSVNKVIVSRNDGKDGHIADLIPDKGPLSGIHSAAMRFPFANLLILPVDLPLMDEKTLQLMINKAQNTQRNIRYEHHNLPLFLNNTKVMRQTLDYTLRCTNCYSVERFCSHFPMLELAPQKQSNLYNANTPTEWQCAMQNLPPLTLNTLSEV